MKSHKILKIAGQLYLVLFVIIWLAGIIGILAFQGISKLFEILSPFNIVNWLITIILLSPAIIIFEISKRISKKDERI